MSRLADPLACPDCRGQVGPDARCTSCGLLLSGPHAATLWRTLLRADELVERLRADQQAAAAAPAPSAPAPAPGPAPVPAAGPAPLPRPAVSGRAVPALLLGLGGLFVVVAVSLFLAVTWSLLPLTVKALIMLGVTSLFGIGAWLSGRHRLRASAEALWTVAGLLTLLDVSAAWRSDLFGLGSLDTAHAFGVSGLLLAGASAGYALVAQRQAIRRCLAAEVGLAFGVLVATFGEVHLGDGSEAVRESVAVPLLVGLVLVLMRRLPLPAYAVAGLAGLEWLSLAGEGVAAMEPLSRAEVWTSLAGWPLAVAALYAAVAAVAGRWLRAPDATRGLVRTVAAGGALACLAVLALLPPDDTSLQLLLLALVLVALAAVGALGLPHWSPAARLVGLAPLLAAVGALVLVPWTAVLFTVTLNGTYDGSSTQAMRLPVEPAGWTLLALAAGVVALGLAWARAHHLRASALAGAAGVLALGALGAVLDLGLPLWLVVAAAAVAAGVAAVGLLLRGPEASWGRLVALAVAADTLLMALVLASQDELVTAVLATVIVAVLVAAWARLKGRAAALVSGLVAVAAVGFTTYAALAWLQVAGTADRVGAPLLAGLAAAVLLAAPRLDTGVSRVLLESAAVLPTLAALAITLETMAGTTALVLTIVGTAVALWSVLYRDRADLGWLATAILGVAFLVRYDAAGGLAPEVYTLPAAALLLGVGVQRLLRDPAENSWRVLGSGLTLALAPSLVAGLPDPESWRMLLVGLGAMAALAVGIGRRWQAPFLAGLVVLSVVALRFWLPLAGEILANPLGAWIFFGTFGMAFLAAGILWEQSLRGLRRGWGYVAALR